MQQYLQNKKGLVQNVFDQVYDQYDLMNDFMSLGIHRLWKKSMLNTMNPSINQNLIDVACGTGDIAKLYIKSTNEEADIMCVDPNINMINSSKKRLNNFKNIKWSLSNAENLKIKSNSYDFYTISFGLRNTKNIKKSLEEAYRVLKPGGRLMILEFSSVNNDIISWFYEKYSFNIIPKLGEFVANDKESYQYLVESIRKFPDQDTFSDMINNEGFKQVKYRDLTFGIAALHSGWKI